ncbi:nucleotide sugar dehydrogenase [Permianibacter aggregans]|uniref:UDP-N-acetyl-D-galactosamine dehydrogenase n=1 Tax=Permianibacter aggregans TaxID=1510150 RepID=A0A4R6UYV6_9GAMM|nr:nucleotide sugar dehydrogenase [Permianibacter aggregans]QGX41384.1 nucleotide sugar dehydrogenase [Permianibacter aggregans]TDQ51173.1 UDP-N-acetyl-D-galactosamine dehydrogenase [Permianibacter aggregans]
MAHQRRIAVIGLGYVGLPVAVAFGRKESVIGFDINKQRIAALQKGHDATGEVTSQELAETTILYTDSIDELRQADFFIVAVPTPVDEARIPDLTPMIKASITVGKALKKGDIVVFESTVYPGATEEDCVPHLERESGLKCGVDFTVGYSPERINPGDKEHTFTKIKKVVSGQDAKTLDIVAAVYESVVTAGVHRASSIKVAEAAKVIENTQRDLNIALMNELAVIFHRMGIDTVDVLEAAGTKWNFLPFRPGLVGGHCIGVDPYYLTHKAQKLGYNAEVILAGRRINDDMGKFVAQEAVKQILQAGLAIKGARVAVLGLTFKEDCPDLRNSKVIDIITELRSFGIEPLVHDAIADRDEAVHEYGVKLVEQNELHDLDHIILAVAHKAYKQMNAEQYRAMLKPQARISDVKCCLPRAEFDKAGITLWRL